MSKPHCFGTLRMTAMTMKDRPGAFKAYLTGEGYTKEEMADIRKAFETVGKEGETLGGKTFGGKVK